MSYKSELQSNNVDLQSILDAVNNLPEAGSGTSEDLDIELTEQEIKIAELISVLEGKAVGDGITPAGTIQITENGTYDVAGYASAEVEVASGNADTSFEDNVLTGDLAGEYTNDRITELRYYALAYCQVAKVTLPNLTSLGLACFYGCSELTEVNIPSFASRLTNNLFYNCSKLETINAPLANAVQSGTFYGCTSLQKFDLPNVTALGANAFNGCSSLIALVLRRTSLVSLTNVNILTGTPIAAGTGYVYVPSSLVDTYKSATNWTTYANQIRAIEDYPDITGD